MGPWPLILDTRETWILMVQENGCPVVMEYYPPESRADAVTLYESRPGATIKQTAADPGLSPETLRNWIRAAGADRPRDRIGEPARSQTPVEASSPRPQTDPQTRGGKGCPEDGPRSIPPGRRRW
ncbi:transposase [Streptomyces sp. NBC_00233]|uniref:transposase n=1 Tax=Streptomyces sp. NBC_00233 TaxID=2975686 RepID=UPI00338DAA6F